MKNLAIIIFLFASINLFAQTTYVPDNYFEQALIDLGYDDVLDNYVLTANISGITFLEVSGKDISDLTGIAGFTSLSSLWCPDNFLTSLDVTANTSLLELNCSNNYLFSIDVSTNTNLTNLDCYENSLSVLNLSANTALTNLICAYNQLTSLDLSANTALISLACVENQLTSLDVSANTALNDLYCSLNQLTSLDVSANTALTYLKCSSNQLTSLDVRNGNNTNFSVFNATSNPNLTCIYVDDATWSTTNWTNIDASSTFVETEAECDALVNINDISDNPFIIYPNPTNDIFSVNTNNIIKSIKIYDVFGKLIKVYNKQDTYSVSDLSTGIYFINIQADKEIFITKIVKE